MKSMSEYSIVSVDKISKKEEVVAPPKDNLVKLYNLCVEMSKLCCENDGVGLAAVQIGIPWKLFIICRMPTDLHFMIDCEYEPVDDVKRQSVEGCLSLRTSMGKLRHFKVERHEKIRVVGQELLADDKLHLEPIDKIIDGYMAVVYQHEIDHAKGILISDIGEEIVVSKGM